MDVLERARALAATAVLGEVAAPTLIALAERAAVHELEVGAEIGPEAQDVGCPIADPADWPTLCGLPGHAAWGHADRARR